MSELRGVIVSHAAVAQALVAAVTAITGIEGVLTAVSNEGCGTEALGERLRQAVGQGPAVLFVDLPGGSCFSSSVRYAKQGGGGAELAVVTGVNLADAARRAVDAGAKAIRVTGAPA
jgi:mannose/fructose-specific phosphotransferase system component IIA